MRRHGQPEADATIQVHRGRRGYGARSRAHPYGHSLANVTQPTSRPRAHIAFLAVLVMVCCLVALAVADARAGTGVGTAAGGDSPGDRAPDAGAASNLVLPISVVVGAVAVGSYTFVKRRRRARTRTTPRSGPQDWG